MDPDVVKMLGRVYQNKDKLQSLPERFRPVVARKIFDKYVLPQMGKGITREMQDAARDQYVNSLLGKPATLDMAGPTPSNLMDKMAPADRYILAGAAETAGNLAGFIDPKARKEGKELADEWRRPRGKETGKEVTPAAAAVLESLPGVMLMGGPEEATAKAVVGKLGTSAGSKMFAGAAAGGVGMLPFAEKKEDITLGMGLGGLVSGISSGVGKFKKTPKVAAKTAASSAQATTAAAGAAKTMPESAYKVTQAVDEYAKKTFGKGFGELSTAQKQAAVDGWMEESQKQAVNERKVAAEKAKAERKAQQEKKQQEIVAQQTAKAEAQNAAARAKQMTKQAAELRRMKGSALSQEEMDAIKAGKSPAEIMQARQATEAAQTAAKVENFHKENPKVAPMTQTLQELGKQAAPELTTLESATATQAGKRPYLGGGSVSDTVNDVIETHNRRANDEQGRLLKEYLEKGGTERRATPLGSTTKEAPLIRPGDVGLTEKDVAASKARRTPIVTKAEEGERGKGKLAKQAADRERIAKKRELAREELKATKALDPATASPEDYVLAVDEGLQHIQQAHPQGKLLVTGFQQAARNYHWDAQQKYEMMLQIIEKISNQGGK